jgi:branched-chain amino acid transport system substrate-binding protein
MIVNYVKEEGTMKRQVLRSFECFCMVVLMMGILALPGVIEKSFAKEPIKIGFIGALSTPYGASNKASLEISIDELNNAGGILGRPVELVTEDWKREVPLAVAAYKKLVMQDKCLLIFTEGTEGSTACAQVGARLYSSYPHLMFAFWTAHAGFTDVVANEYDKYKFVFRVYSSTADSYNPKLKILEFFKNTIGTKKLALLFEDIGWTEVFRKGNANYPTLREDFEKNGIKVVYESNTDIKEKMFLPIFEKVAASGADTIYWLAAYTDTVTLVKQWAQSPAKNMDLAFQGGTHSYAAFWKMTGERALGITAQGPEIAIPFTKLTKPFLDKLKARGVGLIASTFGAYDGPWILKGAVEKAGSANDLDKLIKTIEGGEFQRGFWIWAFDKRHDTKTGYPYQPTPIGQFQENGRYVLVHPKELVEITNPKDKYVRVKDLRKRAGQ